MRIVGMEHYELLYYLCLFPCFSLNGCRLHHKGCQSQTYI
ncbi:Uncharacterised protein [Segatella copri]|nr:Uncharacterised protein [Segatella copri]